MKSVFKTFLFFGLLSVVLFLLGCVTVQESNLKNSAANKVASQSDAKTVLTIQGQIFTALNCRPLGKNLLVLVQNTTSKKEVARAQVSEDLQYQLKLNFSEQLYAFKLYDKVRKKIITTSLKTLTLQNEPINFFGCTQ